MFILQLTGSVWNTITQFRAKVPNAIKPTLAFLFFKFIKIELKVRMNPPLRGERVRGIFRSTAFSGLTNMPRRTIQAASATVNILF